MGEKFVIFISWSTNPAREIALELKGLLDSILTDPDYHIFVSESEDTGIKKGEKGFVKINQNLSNANFGILVLCNNNYERPWLMYEAGAIAKLGKSRVCPILFNRNDSNIEGPIVQFQHASFKYDDKDDFNKLLFSIYESKYDLESLSEAQKNNLIDSLDRHWGVFSGKIKKILDDVSNSDKINKLSDVKELSSFMMNENIYSTIIAKRENVLKEIIANLNIDSSERIIFFGSISSLLREDETIKKFASWLINNSNSKLFFCHESEYVVGIRDITLGEDVYGPNINKKEELRERKIDKVKEMKDALIEYVGNKIQKNIFFLEITKPLSLYIIIAGRTIYATPVFQKRGQNTYTIKLEQPEWCYDLLDYMNNDMIDSSETKNIFVKEIERIQQEIKGEGNKKKNDNS